MAKAISAELSVISIHALLTEGDSNFAQNISINFSIYMLHLSDFTFYGIQSKKFRFVSSFFSINLVRTLQEFSDRFRFAHHTSSSILCSIYSLTEGLRDSWGRQMSFKEQALQCFCNLPLGVYPRCAYPCISLASDSTWLRSSKVNSTCSLRRVSP